jgi:sugar lactone lactonase YvrE
VAPTDSRGPDLVNGVDAGAGGDAPVCSAHLETDSENCGECGHSCLGGACQARVCAFTELASEQIVPSGLAVGGGSVFWTTEGAHPGYVGDVFALSLTEPTAVATRLASTQSYPRALAFADGILYWGNYGDGKVGRWTGVVIADFGRAVNGRLYNIVADSTFVYFSMEVPATDTAPRSGALGRCPLGGCGAATPEIVATAPDATIMGLALDAGTIYWSTFSSNGGVYRLALDGTSMPQMVATGQASPLNIAAFGGYVYWTNSSSNTVARAAADALGGLPPAILASAQTSPWGIAADAGGVYWTNMRGGQVMKLSPNSTTPIVLASGQTTPGHLRIDASYVYWVNTGDNGSIRRVPK